MINENETKSNRRNFVKTASVAAAVTGIATQSLSADANAKTLNVGIVGCGGRGTGAVVNALKADPNVKLTAMADVFKDQLDRSFQRLSNMPGIKEKIAVKDEHKFVGWDAYKQLIDTDVDVVLLTTSPHFRPMHLDYAVQKNKHAFVEKPVAVDGPGVRKMFEVVAEAEKRKLAIVSGLCWRYDTGVKETMKRILGGEIGRVMSAQSTYNGGTLWHRTPKEGWTEMDNQMRNWLYYPWLSGDHINEQAVHTIDKMNWVMNDEHPLSAYGTGGRLVRTDAKYGSVYDHFSITYEYSNDRRGFFNCRQMKGVDNNVSDLIFGTEGTANILRHWIKGKNRWKFRGQKKSMYDLEHIAFFESIRSGKPINNGKYMTESTLTAIMGRMAAYTGKKITWEQALNSKEDLTPKAYAWGDTEIPKVMLPGFNKFS